jgi:hypothetical protein
LKYHTSNRTEPIDNDDGRFGATAITKHPAWSFYLSLAAFSLAAAHSRRALLAADTFLQKSETFDRIEAA